MSSIYSRIIAILRSLALPALCITFFGLAGAAHAATKVSGVIQGDTTWDVANSPYIITNTLTIPANSSLTIDPGVVVKLDGFFFVYVYGTLTTEGTAENPVTITSIKDDTVGGDTNGDGNATSPAPGDWLSLYFIENAHGSFTHTNIRYGGDSNGPGSPLGQIWTQSGTVSISQSTLAFALNANVFTTGGTTTVTGSILAHATNGLRVRGGRLNSTGNTFTSNIRPFTINEGTLALSANDFGTEGEPSLVGAEGTVLNEGNNEGGKGFAVQGEIAGNARWVKDSQPYIITNTLTIPANSSLTIDPGVVVKLDGFFFVYVYGTLTTEGTAENPVTITSIKDDTVGGDTNGDGNATSPAPGDWLSLYFIENAHGSFTHTNIRYGGQANSPGYPMGQIWTQSGVVSVSHSTLEFALNENIFATGGTTTVMDSVLTRARSGIYVSFDYGGSLTVHNSAITGNTTSGVTNKSDETVDATHNWWGHSSGPYALFHPDGQGDAVSLGVDYVPWLNHDPALPPEPSCATNCHSNVLFLPGIMGSRLYDITGKNIWLSDNDIEADYLLMDANGESVHRDIVTKDILEQGETWQFGVNIYKSFLATMKTWETTYGITATSAPYDWRLDYQDLITKGNTLSNGHVSFLVPPPQGEDPYIVKTLKELARTSQTGKVMIVAHSNGGLLAKALLADPEVAALVDNLVLVASPQTGTPEAIARILHGAKASIPGALSSAEARKLALTMPMAYNLLPSTQYFTYTDDPVISFDPVTLPAWAERYGEKIHSTETLRTFLTESERTTPAFDDLATPAIGSTALFDHAQSVHATLDNWTPPPGVHLTTIAGWGEETLAGITYKTERACIQTKTIVAHGHTYAHCLEWGRGLTVTPEHVIDGDGTVVESSAHWAGGGESTRWWVDLKKYNFFNPVETLFGFLAVDHAEILEIPTLNSLIKNILTGRVDTNSSLDYISSIAPGSTVASTSRLHFVLHSPLTLEFYDTYGNHVGYSTSTQRIDLNIPGVHYERYGEVQWLSVPKDITGNLVMNGLSSGSFTLDIEEKEGNVSLGRTSFEGVLSATDTVVVMRVDPDVFLPESGILSIDDNGDGTEDTSLHALLNETVIPDLDVLPDTTPPTTQATATGTLGTNGWYTSDSTLSLTTIDTESGIASTTYSLDNGITWHSYVRPITITQEGTATLLYYSTDTAGNREAANTLIVRIDKTPPEGRMSISTSTQDLLVEGIDTLGPSTVQKEANGTYTITDQAGHTTRLFVTKTYNGKRLTAAQLTGIQYDIQTKITLPATSFLYLWDTKTPSTLLSQTIAVDKTYLIQALYNKTKNTTTVIVLKKNVPLTTQTFVGLRIPRLTTNGGVVGYGL